MPVPPSVTACFATAATAPSRTSPRRRASPAWPEATATGWPSATTTTTAAPTCSSPDGDPMPCTATGAAASKTSPRPRGWGATAIGRPRRPGPTSPARPSPDGDGDLDLYVCHYLHWDAESPRLCRDHATRAVQYCNPRSFDARADHLFRNDGGRFVDVTAASGIVDRDGRGLGVLAADLDQDGRVDLFVANDTTANFFFRNLGGWRFEEAGMAAGVAANASGGYQAGMGVACGDLDGDGRPDLAVTNFYGESTTFYRNLGGGVFGDRTAAIGLAAPSRYRLGFGIALLDADNDGHLDLATANGHVEDYRPLIPYAMPAQLLVGGEDGRLVDVTDA